MTSVPGFVAFPWRRIPRTTRLVAGTGAFGVGLGTGLLPVPCPFRLLTGLDCPFCGGSRVAGALLRGDVVGALDLNAFAVLVVLPLTAVVLIGMARQELGHARSYWPSGRLGGLLGYALLVAVVTWGVVRNLPFEPFTALRA
jgi:hypothetical protein